MLKNSWNSWPHNRKAGRLITWPSAVYATSKRFHWMNWYRYTDHGNPVTVSISFTSSCDNSTCSIPSYLRLYSSSFMLYGRIPIRLSLFQSQVLGTTVYHTFQRWRSRLLSMAKYLLSFSIFVPPRIVFEFAWLLQLVIFIRSGHDAYVTRKIVIRFHCDWSTSSALQQIEWKQH